MISWGPKLCNEGVKMNQQQKHEEKALESWEEELKGLWGSESSFWEKAAPFVWALNTSDQASRKIHPPLEWLMLAAWCWTLGFGMSLGEARTIWQISNAWAALSLACAALTLLPWIEMITEAPLKKISRDKPVKLFIGVFMILLITVGIWSGSESGADIKLMSALPWAAALISLKIGALWLTRLFLEPLNAYCGWHMNSLLHQWRQHLESQGMSRDTLSRDFKSWRHLNSFGASERKPQSDIDWLLAHLEARSPRRRKLPKRLFKALIRAAQKPMARQKTSWSPGGLSQMDAQTLEELARTWMPEALERLRERFELSQLLSDSPKKAPASRL